MPSFFPSSTPAPLSPGAPAAFATSTTALLDSLLTNPDLSATMVSESGPGTMSSDVTSGSPPWAPTISRNLRWAAPDSRIPRASAAPSW